MGFLPISLTGCGSGNGKFSGIYEAGKGESIEFRSGGKADITVQGTNVIEVSYAVDGERIVFSSQRGNFVGKVTKDGIECEGKLYHKR